jgi:hypothetical protein
MHSIEHSADTGTGRTLRDSGRRYLIVVITAIVPAGIDQALTPTRYPCTQAASRVTLTFAEGRRTRQVTVRVQAVVQHSYGEVMGRRPSEMHDESVVGDVRRSDEGASSVVRRTRSSDERHFAKFASARDMYLLRDIQSTHPHLETSLHSEVNRIKSFRSRWINCYETGRNDRHPSQPKHRTTPWTITPDVCGTSPWLSDWVE